MALFGGFTLIDASKQLELNESIAKCLACGRLMSKHFTYDQNGHKQLSREFK